MSFVMYQLQGASLSDLQTHLKSDMKASREAHQIARMFGSAPVIVYNETLDCRMLGGIEPLVEMERPGWCSHGYNNILVPDSRQTEGRELIQIIFSLRGPPLAALTSKLFPEVWHGHRCQYGQTASGVWVVRGDEAWGVPRDAQIWNRDRPSA